jgi:hypothetical protein
MEMVVILEAGFSGSTWLPDGPSGHLQETSGFSMYLRRVKVQLMCHIPTWEWTVFGCKTVPIGCDTYVICSVSLFVHMVAAGVDALCELENLCRLAKHSTFGSATPG